MLASPFGVAVDSIGNLYVSDFNLRVRKIAFDGTIATIAGNGCAGLFRRWRRGPQRHPQPALRPGCGPQRHGVLADTGNSAIRSLVSSGPGVTLAAVVNGASGAVGAIAPGEVVVLWGSGLGPSHLAQFTLSGGLVPTNVAGTSVYFNGTPAPVLYTSSNQVAALVPFGIGGSSAQVFVSYQGQQLRRPDRAGCRYRARTLHA